MSDKALEEATKDWYHLVKFVDDGNEESYYCKSYGKATMDGFTRLNDVVHVPTKDGYKGHNRLGTLEVPNARIKSIKVERVGLAFLNR